jgi:hypothetical protein
MDANLSNFFNTAFNQGVIIHPGSSGMTTFESNPRFILRDKGEDENKIDKTNIENYDIGIPFIVDQRALLEKDMTMSLTLLDQKFLTNNNLSGVTNNFSTGLVNSILSVNIDIIDNESVRDFIIQLQDLSDKIKSAIGQTEYQILYEDYLLSEFEKLYFLNNDKFQEFYLWASSKKIIKTQDILLNDYLVLEKIQSDIIDKDIVDIGAYTDQQLFGRTYEFDLKEVQQNIVSSQQNPNEFNTNIKPSKFHQINTDSGINGDNFSPRKIVNKIYKNLNDPAIAFKGENIFENLYSQIRGIGMARDIENLQDIDTVNETHYNNELMNRLIDSAVASKTRLNKINQIIEVDPDQGSDHYQTIKNETTELESERKNDINYAHIITPSSKRYKQIYVYFNIKETQLNNVSGDKFTIDIKSGNNILSHEHFYYAINERFKSYLFSQFNKKDITVSYRCPMETENYVLIENNSDYNVKCNIEIIKKIDSEERYKDDNDISEVVSKKSTNICYLSGHNEIYGSSASMFLRYSLEVNIKGSSYPIDSFETIKVLQDNPIKKITKKCAIFAMQTDLLSDNSNEPINLNNNAFQGFNNRIILYCNDPNFLSAKFYKRDITSGAGTAYEEMVDTNGQKLGFINAKSISEVFYAKNGNTFEYIAEIMTVKGYTYFSSPFRIKMNKLKDGYVDCRLNQKSLSIIKVKDSTSFIQEIFDIIKADKEEGLYNDDLKAINQAAKDILFAEVEVLKYSKRSNSFYYKSLGDFSHDQIINFKTKVRSLIGFCAIKITPYQSSPILVINLVNDLLSKIGNDVANAGNAVEKSILLSKLKPAIDEIKNESRISLLSNEFIQDGIIPASETVVDLLTELEKIKKSVKLNDVTLVTINSNMYDKNIVSPLSQINIQSCSYIRYDDHRLYINFNLSLNEDNLNKIDFYIVMAEKEKILTPVTAIKSNKTGNFGFFDTSSLSYSGEIRYFLVPVLMSGQFKESIFLKSIIINEYRHV